MTPGKGGGVHHPLSFRLNPAEQEASFAAGDQNPSPIDSQNLSGNTRRASRHDRRVNLESHPLAINCRKNTHASRTGLK